MSENECTNLQVQVLRAMRSAPPKKLSFFKFINCTTRIVRIMWMDFCGDGVTYTILQPGKNYRIITFEGLPWMSEDAQTKTHMLMNNQLVLIPFCFDDEKPNANAEIDEMANAEVRISLPVVTLAERCAEVAAKIFTSPSEIDQLVYPTELKSVLKSYHSNINSL